ncbi:hypothetical protein TNCV_1356351 [Trichonephila clavipes]|uniref:Uncharacterized protein n=1 Tax=Trichonephila clavipes TaxID=2585209 RepID=A0A8X6VD50_TRICX|nr:hypothetical protein TNCV_1356351 [Trichonephila clavipes]
MVPCEASGVLGNGWGAGSSPNMNDMSWSNELAPVKVGSKVLSFGICTGSGTGGSVICIGSGTGGSVICIGSGTGGSVICIGSGTGGSAIGSSGRLDTSLMMGVVKNNFNSKILRAASTRCSALEEEIQSRASQLK